MRPGRRPGPLLAALAAAGGLLAAGGGEPAPLRAQEAAGMAHIGIVVRDAAASAAAYGALTGAATPAVETARGQAEFTAFNLGNVSIELLQQVGDGAGTYADFLDRYGQRAHQVGLHLRNDGDSLDMPQQVERLERHGGVLAADGGGHAYFDLWPRLGLHVEALPAAANDSVYPHPHAVP